MNHCWIVTCEKKWIVAESLRVYLFWFFCTHHKNAIICKEQNSSGCTTFSSNYFGYFLLLIKKSFCPEAPSDGYEALTQSVYVCVYIRTYSNKHMNIKKKKTWAYCKPIRIESFTALRYGINGKEFEMQVSGEFSFDFILLDIRTFTYLRRNHSHHHHQRRRRHHRRRRLSRLLFLTLTLHWTWQLY